VSRGWLRDRKESMNHAVKSRLFIHKVKIFTTWEGSTIAVKYLNLCSVGRIILSYRKGDYYCTK
jgi:hypothetical protein